MSLDEVLREALGLLRDGVADRHSAFRTPTLATVDGEGGPDLRTVVLRAFDASARTLAVHTDARSAKAAQLRANPLVALHVWDAGRRLQIRLRGRASLHTDDATARAAWDGLSSFGRQLYRVRPIPGTTLPDPSEAQLDLLPEADGFGLLTVIAVAFDRLDSLRLTDDGQIRARFDWSADGCRTAWIVP